MDKKLWGPGPWQDEPDMLEFTHKSHDCVLIRNNGGAWCGYAQIPEGHPWHEDLGILDERIDVHGGVTYQGNRMGDGRYFVGFDCAHWQDLTPGYAAAINLLSDGPFKKMQTQMNEILERKNEENTYRDIEFAKGECIKMVEEIDRASQDQIIKGDVDDQNNE